MREEFLELLSYIDFNCFSMTSMCIYQKNQKKSDGNGNLGQTRVQFFIREIGFWEVCLREILNNKVAFPGEKSNPVRFFREVNAGKKYMLQHRTRQ